MADKIMLTRQGYEDIERELEEIITVKRPALVERIREARLLGDLRENFDWEDSKRQQGMMEARLADLKMIVRDATIIECNNVDGCIGLGSKIKIKDMEDGVEEEYTIVGPLEASPSDGRISNESSIGIALIGAAVGDVVSVISPGGEYKYEILSAE